MATVATPSPTVAPTLGDRLATLAYHRYHPRRVAGLEALTVGVARLVRMSQKTKVADELGTHKYAVWSWMRKCGISRRPPNAE